MTQHFHCIGNGFDPWSDPTLYMIQEKRKKNRYKTEGFPSGSVVKNLLTVQETPETRVQSLSHGRFLGGGNGNPLQYSCLKNPKAEEPGGLLSKGSQRSDMTEHEHRTRTQQHEV